MAFLPDAWRSVTALILAAVVIMGSPGPSTISATAMGAAFGLRRSLRYVGGLIAGTTAVLLAVAFGVVALLLAVPASAGVLEAVSAAYILYLAFKIATAPPLNNENGGARAPAFGGGFLLAIANPKAWLAIAAVYAGASRFAVNAGFEALVKTSLLAGMIVLIHFCWLVAGVSLSRALRDPLTLRIINGVLAAALVATTLLAMLK